MQPPLSWPLAASVVLLIYSSSLWNLSLAVPGVKRKLPSGDERDAGPKGKKAKLSHVTTRVPYDFQACIRTLTPEEAYQSMRDHLPGEVHRVIHGIARMRSRQEYETALHQHLLSFAQDQFASETFALSRLFNDAGALAQWLQTIASELVLFDTNRHRCVVDEDAWEALMLKLCRVFDAVPQQGIGLSPVGRDLERGVVAARLLLRRQLWFQSPCDARQGPQWQNPVRQVDAEYDQLQPRRFIQWRKPHWESLPYFGLGQVPYSARSRTFLEKAIRMQPTLPNYDWGATA